MTIEEAQLWSKSLVGVDRYLALDKTDTRLLLSEIGLILAIPL